MLKVYKPELKELWFRQLMLSDEETMSYNHTWGGTIPFPEERWAEWYDRWVVRTEGKRYYRYIMDDTGEFLGEIAYHYDLQIDGFVANVLVYANYMGRGIGSAALELLCAYAKENGIRIMYDDIAADNPALSMFIKHGFKEAYRTDEIIVLKKEL